MTEVNEESVQECAVCGTGIDADDAYTTEADEIVCSDCVRICDRCGDVGHENYDYNVVDSDLWCQDCTDSFAAYCESCEENTRHGTNYVSDRDSYWCDSCVIGCFYCDDCGHYFEEGFCEDCQDTRTIHDYSYRPDPIFHTTGGNDRLFFGVEIEVEAGRGIGDASEYASQLEGQDLAYLKSDGSLNCGFEIVTHPMTHDYYKNEIPEFYEVLDTLRITHGVRSWGTGTCGVHVHISRTGFNGGAHMHRFLNLVYSNEDFYSTIAGRTSDRWAKFSDIKTTVELPRDEHGYRAWKEVKTFKNKIQEGRHTDRYSAVNTQNRETLEMRIFRGTTQPHVIKSYIDLAHASVEYTRSMSVKEVTNGALTPAPFIEYIVNNSKLYPELVERINRLYINLDIMSASRQEVSA